MSRNKLEMQLKKLTMAKKQTNLYTKTTGKTKDCAT